MNKLSIAFLAAVSIASFGCKKKGGAGEAMAKMGPALQDLLAKMDDIRNYEPPEMLPNGDIILRRKLAAPPKPPVAGPEIDL